MYKVGTNQCSRSFVNMFFVNLIYDLMINGENKEPCVLTLVIRKSMVLCFYSYFIQS